MEQRKANHFSFETCELSLFNFCILWLQAGYIICIFIKLKKTIKLKSRMYLSIDSIKCTKLSILSINANKKCSIIMSSLAMTMADRGNMTSTQTTIAYSAIVVGILAVISAFGTSIHILYHFYTSSGLARITFCIAFDF